ncbi:MAG: hypothetical protein QOE90_575 [Thermoplasmata archaeon]|jgi:hypothetical protein|nr:hypothetical protein [Thermoplasmata archaeon]
MPYRYVCLRCWSLPFAYFPDKVLAPCGECWIPSLNEQHVHVAPRERAFTATRKGESGNKKVSGHGFPKKATKHKRAKKKTPKRKG